MSFEFERWTGDGKPDAAALRNRLQSEGYDVDRCPGTVHPLHSHSEDQSQLLHCRRQEMFIDRAAGFDLLSPFVSDEETYSSYGAGIVTIG